MATDSSTTLPIPDVMRVSIRLDIVITHFADNSEILMRYDNDKVCMGGCGLNEDVDHLFVRCDFFFWQYSSLISNWLAFATTNSDTISAHYDKLCCLAGFSKQTRLTFKIIWLCSVWGYFEGMKWCVSCLSPAKSFAAFDVNKLLKMTEFYPNNFIDVPKVAIRTQLKNYVTDVRSDPKFAKLKGLSDLCLTLLLPVAIASVERVFSDMKVVKSNLCNKMGDQWLNDRLVTYI
ncbi:hypothetical protein MTR_4g015110 [Medicago truncatula]|uniref:HAT C-terminal dimerisation domain-containing protein n=1 Tax=Medicago truncatula TaxID=3880 RepID=G7JMY9_MEDTR|nr:hypothetical protein MTR_4g015110 [Medicago truncatula]